MTNKVKKQTVLRFSQSLLEMPDEEPNFEDAFKVRELLYDVDGNIVQESEFDVDETESEKHVRVFNNGKIVELKSYFENELSETNLYTYNDAGLLISETVEYADGGKLFTTYTYDSSNNKLEKRVVDADNILESFEKFSYHNNLLTEHIKYDADGNVTEQINILYKPDSDVLSEEIVFIADSNLKLRTVYADNHAGTTTYNADGKLHGRTKNTFDEKGRLIAYVQETYKGTYITKYFYDENDNIIEEEKQIDGTIYFKSISSFYENNMLKQRTITEINSGAFTDYYQYEFYDND